jgi:hypothetical protein
MTSKVTCLCLLSGTKRCGRCRLLELAEARSRKTSFMGGQGMRADDVLEIIGVTNLYALAVDTRRWDLFDRVFAADAQADFGGPARWEDLASLKRDFAAIHEPFAATQHVTTNHQVVGAGERANCMSYVRGCFIREVPEGGNMFESGGWYDDAFVKTFAGWRIQSRTCRTVWTQGNPLVLQTMPGVTVEQKLDSLGAEAKAGRLAYLQAFANADPAAAFRQPHS